MIDLLTNLPALIGGVVALIIAALGYGKVKKRQGRKEGAQEVTDKLKEADHAEANDIRRRVDAARELHTADSGRGFRD